MDNYTKKNLETYRAIKNNFKTYRLDRQPRELINLECYINVRTASKYPTRKSSFRPDSVKLSSLTDIFTGPKSPIQDSSQTGNSDIAGIPPAIREILDVEPIAKPDPDLDIHDMSNRNRGVPAAQFLSQPPSGPAKDRAIPVQLILKQPPTGPAKDRAPAVEGSPPSKTTIKSIQAASSSTKTSLKAPPASPTLTVTRNSLRSHSLSHKVEPPPTPSVQPTLSQKRRRDSASIPTAPTKITDTPTPSTLDQTNVQALVAQNPSEHMISSTRGTEPANLGNKGNGCPPQSILVNPRSSQYNTSKVRPSTEIESDESGHKTKRPRLSCADTAPEQTLTKYGDLELKVKSLETQIEGDSDSKLGLAAKVSTLQSDVSKQAGALKYVRSKVTALDQSAREGWERVEVRNDQIDEYFRKLNSFFDKSISKGMGESREGKEAPPTFLAAFSPEVVAKEIITTHHRGPNSEPSDNILKTHADIESSNLSITRNATDQSTLINEQSSQIKFLSQTIENLKQSNVSIIETATEQATQITEQSDQIKLLLDTIEVLKTDFTKRFNDNHATQRTLREQVHQAQALTLRVAEARKEADQEKEELEMRMERLERIVRDSQFIAGGTYDEVSG